MKICFFGAVYEALIGNVIGGAELQMALLAKALAKGGHEVIVIDTNLDKVVENIENIKILNCSKGGIRKIRFFTQKLPNYIKFSFAIKADIYYVRGRGYSQIIPLIVGKIIHKKIFIKAISSDIDLMPLFKRLKITFKYRKNLSNWLLRGIITELLFSAIIKQSSLLLLQHQLQFDNSLNTKAKKFLFPNLFDIKAHLINSKQSDRKSFLYVGTISPKKGFNELKYLVTKLPNIQFHIIGSPETKGNIGFNDFVSLNNVLYHGKQDITYILSLMENSISLINTSPNEGFPNTFIESWYSGCPVASLNVDPGGVLTSGNLGFCFNGDIQSMIDYIIKMERGAFNYDPQHLREFVIENHSSESGYIRFNQIIQKYMTQREYNL